VPQPAEKGGKKRMVEMVIQMVRKTTERVMEKKRRKI
jgi:F0F1-type ATP synthase membrane subunit a